MDGTYKPDPVSRHIDYDNPQVQNEIETHCCCLNCDNPMTIIEVNVQGLPVGWRCEACGDEHWPYDMPGGMP